jgi:hypothetical protein
MRQQRVTESIERRVIIHERDVVIVSVGPHPEHVAIEVKVVFGPTCKHPQVINTSSTRHQHVTTISTDLQQLAFANGNMLCLYAMCQP